MAAPLSWLSALLGLLYRQRCGGCDAWGERALCDGCSAQWPALPPGCGVCLEPPPDCRCEAGKMPLSAAYAAGAYAGVAKRAIGALKFGGRRSLAPMLAARLRPLVPAGDWLLVPVPLAPDRQRDYNQAELLARALARAQRLPFRRALRRSGPSASQRGLGRAERLANMEGAFAATCRLAGARVLLIDDVMTTGATAQGAARALLAAGASEVRLLVVAKTTRAVR